MIITLDGVDLLIRGRSSFLLAGIISEPFTLFIETASDEYCQTMRKGDIVAVSAPEGGAIEQASCLLELVRTWHAPLVVLPKGHPGSGRLNMIVSAGDRIWLNCGIARGTHPEQHLICSSDELAGILLEGVPGGIDILHHPDDLDISTV
ncbi:MAG TPA: alpha/beta hydrolase [Methanospirillum sp.]|nr:alpha/beta hydrolase [Methanospirillum sp.]